MSGSVLNVCISAMRHLAAMCSSIAEINRVAPIFARNSHSTLGFERDRSIRLVGRTLSAVLRIVSPAMTVDWSVRPLRRHRMSHLRRPGPNRLRPRTRYPRVQFGLRFAAQGLHRLARLRADDVGKERSLSPAPRVSALRRVHRALGQRRLLFCSSHEDGRCAMIRIA